MVSGRYSFIPILEVLVVDELALISNSSQIAFHYLTSRTVLSPSEILEFIFGIKFSLR